MKKDVRLDNRAKKEIENFPEEVQKRLKGLVELLSHNGYLEVPYGKSLTRNIFEIRINYRDVWRILYSYLEGNQIIILLGFQKKSQKTAKHLIDLAIKRSKIYE